MSNISGLNAITSFPKYACQAVTGSKPAQQKTSIASANSADKVTISAAAQMSNGVEKYALPDWIGGYVAPLNDLTNSEAMESAKKASALFDGVKGDEKAARQFLDNDAANKKFRQNLQMYDVLKPELDQYGKYRKQALDAAMQAVGVTGDKSYRDITSSDPSAADRAHRVFKEVLVGMPDVKSLMSRLDVPAARTI